MRKYFIIAAAAAILSCGQGQNTKGETNSGQDPYANKFPNNELILVKEGTTNEVLLSEIKKSLTGKVQVYDGVDVYIVDKWETKSAVSYEVLGEKKAELLKLNGKIVTANGMVEKTGAYSGTIKVESFKLK